MKKIGRIRIPRHLFLVLIISGFILGISATILAQNQVIDSLLLALEVSSPDTNKIKLYNDLSWELHRTDVEKSANYAKEAITLAEQLDFPRGLSRGYNLLAIYWSSKGDNETAYDLNQRALKIAQIIGDKKLMSECLNDIGIYLAEKGRNKEALEKYQKSLMLAEEIKDTLGISFSLSNIGLTYSDLGDTINAKKYLLASVDVGKKSNQNMALGGALLDLGYLLWGENNYSEAREKFDEVLSLAKQNQDKFQEMESLLAISGLNTEAGHFELGLKNSAAALVIAEKMEQIIFQIFSYHQMASIYQKKGDLNKAIQSASEGLRIAEEAELTTEEIYLHKTLIKLYEEKGAYKEAYTHLQKNNQLKDTLNFADQQKEIVALEAKYQNEKKEVENQLLREEASKNEAIMGQRQVGIYATGIVLIFVSLLAILLYFAYREKISFNEKLKKEVEDRTAALQHSVAQLEKSNQELESFAYIASHDLKEPIRNIGSFTSLALRSLQKAKGEEVQEYLNFVRSNAQQMYLLIEDVLEYSKIGRISKEYQEMDLNSIVEKVETSLKTTMIERNAVVSWESLPAVFSDPTQLFIVLKNLIENGIKYNESEVPRVIISSDNDNQKFHTIKISDNGIGIEEAYQSRVFEMFKRLHNRSEYQGSGLGLSICKKTIVSMGGALELESKPGKGSTFTILIPKSENTSFLFYPAAEESSTVYHQASNQN